MLILVRHGRTDANARGLLLGRLDPPLDELGVRQAAAVHAVTGDPARLVASPLRRARETADAFGVAVEVDDRWVEIDYGDYDGMSLAEVPRDLWDGWRADTARRAPGGESLDDVGRRVAEACEALASEAHEGNVVVVSHVSPIKAAVAWALDTGQQLAWRLHLAPGSITRIGISQRGPVVHGFNETCHLQADRLARLTRR